MKNTRLSIQPALPLAFPSSLPVLSLFSGAGGLDHGFKMIGFDPILAIDINHAAIETYRRNHPETRAIQANLATLDPATIIDLWEESAGGERASWDNRWTAVSSLFCVKRPPNERRS